MGVVVHTVFSDCHVADLPLADVMVAGRIAVVPGCATGHPGRVIRHSGECRNPGCIQA